MNTTLEFQQVTLAEGPGHDMALESISFALPAGGLALFELEPGLARTPLADLACGLLDPDSGAVLFEGQPWAALDPAVAARARSRIGRVFEGAGWVSNLDVDENITLAARYHGTATEAEALAAASALALRLELDALPAGRPAHVARPALRRAEWVRALLPPRTLVLLERPLNEVPAAWAAPLQAEVERMRAQGVAFLWIETAGSGLPAGSLKPTLHFQVGSGNIRRVTHP